MNMAEIELECAVYGEATVFPVKIGRNAKVSALQEAIFEKKRCSEDYKFAASDLTLYLAKRKKKGKKSKWLTGGQNVDDLLREDVDPTYKKVFSWRKLDKEELFGSSFIPGDEEIHVLVELPPLQIADPRLIQLQESLLHHVLMDAPTSTPAASDQFKANLRLTYNCDLGNSKLRCMLLDTPLPSNLVIASHFRRSNEFLSEKLMGFSHIDDVKNGLLLFMPLEHAFDHFQISFIYDKSTDAYHLEIFDGSLRGQRLFDKLAEKQKKILLQGHTLPSGWETQEQRLVPGTAYDPQTTLVMLKVVQFPFASSSVPTSAV